MGWTSRQVKTLTVSLAILGVVVGAGWVQGTFAAKDDEGPMTPERVFPASSKCKKCHIRANEEYEESTIARAIVSPTFRAMLEDYVSNGKDNHYCLNCHAPQSLVFPDIVASIIKQTICGDLTIAESCCIQWHLIKLLSP